MSEAEVFHIIFWDLRKEEFRHGWSKIIGLTWAKAGQEPAVTRTCIHPWPKPTLKPCNLSSPIAHHWEKQKHCHFSGYAPHREWKVLKGIFWLAWVVWASHLQMTHMNDMKMPWWTFGLFFFTRCNEYLMYIHTQFLSFIQVSPFKYINTNWR